MVRAVEIIKEYTDVALNGSCRPWRRSWADSNIVKFYTGDYGDYRTIVAVLVENGKVKVYEESWLMVKDDQSMMAATLTETLDMGNPAFLEQYRRMIQRLCVEA